MRTILPFILFLINTGIEGQLSNFGVTSGCHINLLVLTFGAVLVVISLRIVVFMQRGRMQLVTNSALQFSFAII